jgi:hypothetical protein
MGRYQNFKLVLYCTAQNMVNISEEALLKQLDFFLKYCGCDKVYLEPYRDGLMIPEEQLKMLKRVFTERGIEVSGALTTTCPDLCEEDTYKQRMGGTYCYTNRAMRDYLVKTVRYTARHFDEFIIDDWFFTYCTCDECRAAKGDLSWEDFRTQLLAEVSKDLIIKSAKEVNPNCKVIIKYPNWSESYQESGYNPIVQKDIFDSVYTGTETRDTKHTDQHLPKYVSYSLMRLMENYAPGRNGGGWFDPYGCSPMELYLEQAYLTAFARAKELCLFCWGSLYKNRVVTPLGLQLELIDEMLSKAGSCTGVPCYLPPMAQGEDHIEDFLGMAGIPFELTPFFPEKAQTAFFTVQALKDPAIIEKLKKYISEGGRAVVTSGFIIEALRTNRGIEDLTSIRYLGRRFTTDEFIDDGMMPSGTYRAGKKMSFNLLEHRTNTTWALAKAVVGEENYPIVLRDCYGRGQMITLNIPDEYGYIYSLPAEILRVIREQFRLPYRLDGPGQISMFCYDNDVFALYAYTGGLTSGRVSIVTDGRADSLVNLNTGMKLSPSGSTRDGGTIFNIFMLSPGDINFYKIEWNENRFTPKKPKEISSAPHEFNV